MSPTLQERLLPVFHFALNPGGFLVLGRGRNGRAVRRSVRAGQPRTQDLPRRRTAAPAAADLHGGRLAGRRRADSGRRRPLSRRSIFSARPTASCSAATRRPACWSTTSSRSSSSAAGPRRSSKRRPASRPPNILRMAREGLFLELRSALTEAKTTRAPVVRERPARHRRRRATSSSRCACCRSTSRSPPTCCLLVLFEAEGLAGVVGGRQRAGRRPDHGGPRRRLAAAGTGRRPSSTCSRSSISRTPRPGTARRARGSAVEQRGTAEHERGTGDHQGGAAVGQRRTDDASTSSFRAAIASSTR